jgi:hypothetical protein
LNPIKGAEMSKHKQINPTTIQCGAPMGENLFNVTVRDSKVTCLACKSGFTKEENVYHLTGQTYWVVLNPDGWVISFCWTEEEADAVIERLTTKKEQS